MPLAPNFTASQFTGSPSYITLTDTSTGSDVSIVSRKVFIQSAFGTFLVPSGTITQYFVWALANTSTTVSILTQDTAVSITVQWVDVGGNPVVSKTISFAFIAYSQTFLLNQGTAQLVNPQIVGANQYINNRQKVRELLDSAQQAIVFASDLYGSQQCLNKATEMISPQNYYF